jgi:Ca2+-binding RTX toxin-like protein
MFRPLFDSLLNTPSEMAVTRAIASSASLTPSVTVNAAPAPAAADGLSEEWAGKQLPDIFEFCPISQSDSKTFAITHGTFHRTEGSAVSVPSTIADEGTLNVIVGGSVSGVLDNPADHDTAVVFLTAGQVYLISVRGTGATPADDTFINIFNPSAVNVGHDDDGGNDLDSLITITAAVTGNYSIDISSANPVAAVGGYTVDVRVRGVDAVGNTNATSVHIDPGTTTFGFRESGSTPAGAPFSGDLDRYSVDLVAGHFYTFKYAGGSDYETGYYQPQFAGDMDTFLRLRNAAGTLVAQNDDVGFPDDLSSAIGFYATVTGTYYLDATAYSGYTGGYAIEFQDVNFAAENPLDSIDWQNADDVQFTDVAGVPTAYVYFALPGETFGELADNGTDPLPSYGWNAREQTQFMQALEEYEHILGVNYEVTTDVNQATFRVITTTSTQYGAYFYPQDPAFGTQQGIGAFNVNSGGWDKLGFSTQDLPGDQVSLDRGGFSFAVILHELGHAHGLAHPHDNGGGSDVMLGVTGPTGSYGLFNLNQGVYTVMSYNDAWDFHPDGPSPFTISGIDNGWSASLGAFDIAQLQTRYGVHDYNTGNTTYSLSDIVDDAFYETIWDTGGDDTIAYTGTLSATIDLTAATLDYSPTGGGVVSYVIDPAPGTSPLRGGYTIANTVVIENASGGSGNDVLVGNSAANGLNGNGGSDNMFGRAGNDLIDGGAGSDTARYETARADYQVTANFDGNGQIVSYTVQDLAPLVGTIAPDEGTDTVSGTEALAFSNVTLALVGTVVLYDGSNNLVGVFSTIQAAVNASSNGYTVQCSAGTYAETVTVDKDITILGANSGTPGTDSRIPETVVTAFYITGAGATLDGLEVLDGASPGGNSAGIFVNADNVTLTNMVFEGSSLGSRPAVTTPYNGDITGLVLSDSLIHDWDWGTYFNPTTGFTATGNTFDGNGNAILGDDWATGTFIENNTFTNSAGSHIGYGVFDTVTDMRDFVGTNSFEAPNNAVSMFAYGDGDAGGQTITGTDDANGFFASEFVAGSGTDSTFNGLAGNDRFYGGSSDDNLNGGDDFDTALYDGPSSDYTIVYDYDIDGNVIGFLEVTDNNLLNGNEGHDLLNSIEALSFDDVNINIGDPVKVYDTSNILVGTFTSIQDAIDFSSDGYRITAEAGTYSENLTVDKDVTIQGANVGLAGTDGGRGAETIIDGSINVTVAGVAIDGVEVVGTSNFGFDVGIYVQADDFSLINSVLDGPDLGGNSFGILTQLTLGLEIADNLIRGYAVGIYISSGDSTGAVHDNLFQGDGGPITGLGNGVNSETSGVLINDNTFDGLYAGVINVFPFGPDPVDLNTYIFDNIFTDNAAERVIQIYPTVDSLNFTGTDESESFNADISGVTGEEFSYIGNGGNDRAYGGALNDTFTGDAGSDRLYGNGGDDSLNGGADDDLLDGGTGLDTAGFVDNSVTWLDTVIGWVTTSSEGNDVLTSVEIAQTGSQRNLLVGSTALASIQAASNLAVDGDFIQVANGTWGGTVTYDDANLVVIAQPGATLNTTFTTVTSNGITVFGGNNADNITTSIGNDVIAGGAGADVMAGGAGNDLYLVDNANDVVIEAAGEGNDVLAANTSYVLGAGSEVELMTTGFIGGTSGIDLAGNELNNQIWGNNGANTLIGGDGADILVGFGGNDLLIGGNGADTMIGGTGDDLYFVDNAGDAIGEAVGEGSDSLAAGVSYTLTGGASIELMTTGFIGGTGAINLTGNELGNQIWGNNGDNVLNGGAGNDVLFGFGGADTFAFTTALGAGNVDVIGDFTSGTDKIALDDAVFTAMGSLGALNPNAFVAGTAAGDADDRIIYDAATGNIYYDADGNGGGAQVLFANVGVGNTLLASDFQVI